MTYTGMTNSLLARVHQHKSKAFGGYTSRYNITRLVHFEETDDVREAIRREKELKGWNRDRKVALIQKENPMWKDLAADWYDSLEIG
jgi:putative endonuclease